MSNGSLLKTSKNSMESNSLGTIAIHNRPHSAALSTKCSTTSTSPVERDYTEEVDEVGEAITGLLNSGLLTHGAAFTLGHESTVVTMQDGCRALHTITSTIWFFLVICAFIVSCHVLCISSTAIFSYYICINPFIIVLSWWCKNSNKDNQGWDVSVIISQLWNLLGKHLLLGHEYQARCINMNEFADNTNFFLQACDDQSVATRAHHFALHYLLSLKFSGHKKSNYNNDQYSQYQIYQPTGSIMNLFLQQYCKSTFNHSYPPPLPHNMYTKKYLQSDGDVLENEEESSYSELGSLPDSDFSSAISSEEEEGDDNSITLISSFASDDRVKNKNNYSIPNRNNKLKDATRKDLSVKQQNKKRNCEPPTTPTDLSKNNSDDTQVVNWVNFGATIGMRLLSNEAVIQEVVLNDGDSVAETDKCAPVVKHGANPISISIHSPASQLPQITSNTGGKEKVVLPPPVHSIWTSPTAAASRYNNDILHNQKKINGELLHDDNEEEYSGKNCQSDLFDKKKDDEPQRCCSPSHHLIYVSTVEDETRDEVMHSPILQRQQQHPRLDISLSKSPPLHSTPCRQQARVDLTSLSEPTHSEICSPNRILVPPVVEGFEVDLVGRQLGLKSSTDPKPRDILEPGVKMVVPIFPSVQKFEGVHGTKVTKNGFFQMATVIFCHRIYLSPGNGDLVRFAELTSPRDSRRILSNSGFTSKTNCLHLCLALDKSYLRNGKFALIHIRIRDDQAMPPHSKYPIGSCVATSFGVGVLVGWRVEDDCHVVRSLWQCRGNGAASAYLQRDCLKGAVEAAVGFRVTTPLGQGKVVAYVESGTDFLSGRYIVAVEQPIQKSSGSINHEVFQVIGFDRLDILSCAAPRFLPIIEHIREAAKFQLQLEDYNATIQSMNPGLMTGENEEWGSIIASGFEKAVSCLFRAVDEDPNFDKEMNTFVANIIRFLEPNDPVTCDELSKRRKSSGESFQHQQSDHLPSYTLNPVRDDDKSDFWLLDDFVNFLFGSSNKEKNFAESNATQIVLPVEKAEIIWPEALGVGDPTRAFGVIRTLIRAATIARVESESENVRMLLNSCIELLLFARTILKVRKQNSSQATLENRMKVFQLAKMTFDPIKERILRLWGALTKRLERKGRKAKMRLSRLANILIRDDIFMAGIENREWSICISQLESAVVKARLLDAPTCAQIHSSALILYNSLAPKTAKRKAPSASDNLFALLARLVKWIATPWRTVLQLLKRDDVLEVFERILIRVFEHKEEACQMLNIYAYNFHSFRHLIVLKNMQITSNLWHHLLETAHAELAWIVSQMPDNRLRYFAQQVCKIFGLGIIHFETIKSGEPGDWMDFLMEEKAVELIQDIDREIFSMAENFCNDIKGTFEVLPYYASIDDDIANLVEELHLKTELIHAAEAIVDSDKFMSYIHQKAIVAIDRFFDYLPKVRIPVHKREIAEGWLLTCRASDGGDLCLSNFLIKRELFSFDVRGHPSLDRGEAPIRGSKVFIPSDINASTRVEISVLDEVRNLIENAQKYGCWIDGEEGKNKSLCSDVDYKALKGIPLSQVLCTAVQLWHDLEIDDDELMEIAVRDVSYQIKVNEAKKTINEGGVGGSQGTELLGFSSHQPTMKQQNIKSANSFSTCPLRKESDHERIKELKDPLVLTFEMTKLSCMLDDFKFRVEPKTQYSFFDVVFEGVGTIRISDLSLKISLECRKENQLEPGNTESFVPVLQLFELEVGLDDVSLSFRDTGIDWLLNPILKNLQENITIVVETTLQQQLENQVQEALFHVNSFLEVHPDLLLKLLGIKFDDLEENLVWV